MVKLERTLAIIKPDAVGKHCIGGILQRLEAESFEIRALKMLKMDTSMAERFYAEHKERPFFRDLVQYMISGPVVVACLEGDNAIQRYRDFMGATDPKKAAPKTLRAEFGVSIEHNAVHGSDGLAAAEREVPFFFSAAELF
jgi:nucleoside-diphosphate kinase